jgi:tryptophan synthase alpha chain
VIQKATQVALEKGITIRKSLEALRELRQRGVDIPLVLMGYYNPMLAYGLDRFVCDAIEAGADGFIIPDLPSEEAEEFQSALSGASRLASAVDARAMNDAHASTVDFAPSAPSSTHSSPGVFRERERLPLIQMLAPTTSNERMEMIARNAQGFVYLVSVTGVTGERKSISEGLADLIARVREHTSVPVCVGFGISTPEQAKQVGALADGVIVGSACVKIIGESKTPVEAAREFARSFADALR